MLTPEALGDGEFLILSDDSFHAVGQAGLQIQITPTALYLTNLHLFMEPQFDVEITRKIALSEISGFVDAIVNDCPVLDIVSTDSGQTIHLFIPDETRKTAFTSIVSRLIDGMKENQEACDKEAMQLRRSCQNSESLQSFYESVINGKTEGHEQNEAEKEEKKAVKKKARETVHRSLIPFNFFADFVQTSDHLFFAVAILTIGILSKVFKYVSFGTFISAALFTLIVVFGLQKVRGKKHIGERINPEDAEPAVREFLASSNKFLDHIERRIFWGVPESTLETVTFLLTLVLLFMLFDPVWLLLISLVGLAFFDRWDPFGCGSLSTILSNLILW